MIRDDWHSFAWTGDTRPIPEMLGAYAANDELVAHDCALVANPSHTGIDDVEREYAMELRQRLMLYHYASEADAREMERRGLRVARRGEVVALAMPLPRVPGSS
jgi:ribonuclease BN (tRNA processing enzyme)